MQNFNSGFTTSQSAFRSMTARSGFFFQPSTGRITLDWKRRLRREFSSKRVLLDEKSPTKFATTSWFESQIPYAVYRVLVFIYAIVLLAWKAYYEVNFSDSQKWILSLPTWNFILFTFYSILVLIFAILQFFHDCLCNDDFSWYHKVAWVVQSIVFNGAVFCFFGGLIYEIALVKGDMHTTVLMEAFTSDNINFTFIVAMLMIVDVFVTNITVHLLHFVFPCVFYVLFFLFHVYRWSAGNTPVYMLLDYGNHPASSIGVIFIISLLVSPALHFLAYTVDSLRSSLLLTYIGRHRRRFIEMTNASDRFSSFTRERTHNSKHPSSAPVHPSNTISVCSDTTPQINATMELFCKGSLAFY